MKLKVNRESLLPLIPLISDIASKPSATEIVSQVKLSVQNNLMELHATNYDISLISTVPCETEEEGSICVNAKKFTSALRELVANDLDMNVESNWLRIKSGNSTLDMAGMPGQNFPEFEKTVPENGFRFKIKDWFKDLHNVAYAIGENLSRRNLTGVNISGENGKLIFTASDSYRMAIVKYEQEVEFIGEGTGNIIVPKKAIQEMLRIPDDGSGKISVYFDEKNIVVMNDICFIKARLIEAVYPNLQRILYNDPTHFIEVDSSEMIRIMKLSRVFGDLPSSHVEINVKGNRMLIKNEMTLENKSVNAIDCLYDGPELDMTLNIKYLMEALQILDGETVQMSFKIPKHPVLITSAKYPELLNILMPVKISEVGAEE